MKKLLSITVFSISLSIASGQVEIKNIVPLSPNASAITTYGEYPVSLYTGVPDISIPIYTVKSRKINLPLSIAYHAGGNKVESIASWIGLGWSLQTIPSISRSVKGIPDEAAGGFLGLYEGKTVKQLYEERFNSSQQQQRWFSFTTQVYSGAFDSEPDIFFYNILGKSGKFFYSQELQKFITYPSEDIKINFDGQSFIIIDDNGIKYVFNDRELQTSAAMAQGAPIITSWNVTQIKDANNIDNITFAYNVENQYFRNVRVNKNYYLYQGLGTCYNLGVSATNESVISAVSSTALRLTTITFEGGKVVFVPSASPRLDLSGGYSLGGIEIFDYRNVLVKKVEFGQNYITSLAGGGYPCTGTDLAESKWLFLSSIAEAAIPFGNERLIYTFEYDESTIPPCRTTAAQDYWGYYNGKTLNSSLIPKTGIVFPGTSTPVMVGDADRHVDPAYTQFGILKKINYPTGGFTQFTFENNIVPASESTIPFSYEQNGTGIDMPAEITTNYFSGTFTINNTSDDFLNANNPNGGAFLNIYSGGFGCSLLAGANTCADIKIRGVSPNNSNMLISINGNRPNNTYVTEGLYVPNGDYVMEATFNQDPIQFQNFYLSVNWYKRKTNSANPGVKLAPGLRIKKISSSSGITGDVLEKTFKYTTSINSDFSSGKMVSNSRLDFKDNYEVLSITTPRPDFPPTTCTDLYVRLSSYSNTEAVTHSGSYVGYSKVFVETENNSENGYVEHDFLNVTDITSGVFPYEPLPSNEHLRGLPSTEIAKTQNHTSVNVTQNDYQEMTGLQASFGIKIASLRRTRYDPGIELQHIPEYAKPYELLSTKTVNTTKIQKSFSSANQQDVVTYAITNLYSPNHNRLLETSILNSENQVVNSAFKYPSDYPANSVYQEMVNRNILTPIVQETKANLSVNLELEKSLNTYSQLSSSLIIVPQKNEKSFKGAPFDVELEVILYDNKSNILQAKSKNGVVVSFVWGFNQLYPIAKIVGANYADVMERP
jgi:hypothetical protein